VVKLRLMRMGKKKQPFYRVVAADSRSPRNGRFIQIVGTYDPRREPSVIEIDNEKAVSWLRNGAQPTERVEKLLKLSGAWDDFKGLPEGTSVSAPPAPKAKPEPAPPAAEAASTEAPATEAPPTEAPPTEAASSEPAPEPAADDPASDEAAAEAPATEAASTDEAGT
jgi:small subunit ribosomal protein S16